MGYACVDTPNPFVEIVALPESVQQDMQAGNHETLIAHLSSSEVDSFGSAFDVTQLDPDLLIVDSEADPVGPLGRFLSRLEDDTLLPVAESSEHYGKRAVDRAEEVLAAARSMERERRIRNPVPPRSGLRRRATLEA